MAIGKHFTFKTHLLFAEQVADQDVPQVAEGLRAPWQVTTKDQREVAVH